MKDYIPTHMGVAATPDMDETLRLAGLDWEPVEVPVSYCGGQIFPNRKVLIRSDNQDPLGLVGRRYNPTRPKDFLERQYQLAEQIHGKVERVGFLPGASSVFSLISLGEFQIQTARKVGDPVRTLIFTRDGWNGTTPIQSRLYIERLICTNGMTSRRLQASIWVSHTIHSSVYWRKRVDRFSENIERVRSSVEKEFNILAGIPMSHEQAAEFMVQLIPGKHKQAENTRSQLLSLFHSGVGNTGSTRYDALNAVTEYSTHHRRYRGEGERVLERRFLGVMESDPLRERALSLLLPQ